MPSRAARPAGTLETSQRLHQELLARRLASAKTRHDAAWRALRDAIDACGSANPPDPEGWREILEARFQEADALSDYIAALRAFAAPAADDAPGSSRPQ
jgi:hypothetical protein